MSREDPMVPCHVWTVDRLLGSSYRLPESSYRLPESSYRLFDLHHGVV